MYSLSMSLSNLELCVIRKKKQLDLFRIKTRSYLLISGCFATFLNNQAKLLILLCGFSALAGLF